MNNDEIAEALQMLVYHRGSMFDYAPQADEWMDDFKFAEENPDHPQSMEYRFTRQQGADYLNNLAGSDPNAINSEALAVLHESLFETGAAVRLAIAEALGKLARKESVPFLEKLVATEVESKRVRAAAEVSLERCRI